MPFFTTWPELLEELLLDEELLLEEELLLDEDDELLLEELVEDELPELELLDDELLDDELELLLVSSGPEHPLTTNVKTRPLKSVLFIRWTSR